ncbi:hypothetical protein JZ751_003328 [Albula glossodonta]|uniref:Uncharacterized protein n=1 Tax=Albula glossodonta TaxID=121402 RepID=A0A8T2NEE8_9TELE|nr:hypothetical protein JZ751_003328 [Albula glossodonta]
MGGRSHQVLHHHDSVSAQIVDHGPHVRTHPTCAELHQPQQRHESPRAPHPRAAAGKRTVIKSKY